MSCMIQKVGKKVTEQLEEWVSLLAEIRLNLNEGIQNTFSNIKDGNKETVPIWETGARLPLGSLTDIEPWDKMDVREELELTMWLVALGSMIEGTELLKEPKQKELPERLVDACEVPAWWAIGCEVSALRRARSWW